MSELNEKRPKLLALAVVLAWILLAVGAGLFIPQPNFTELSGSATYLPPDLESQAAQIRLRDLFPDSYRYSTAVVVLHREGGLSLEDLSARVPALVQWIHNPKGLSTDIPAEWREPVEGFLRDAPIRSVSTDPYLASRLTSPAGDTTLVLVGMPDIFTGQKTQHTVRAIRDYLRTAPLGGLEFEITGDAGFYFDYAQAALQSVDRSTLVTMVLVVVILLVVYRSPLAMLVPMMTIGLAVFVAIRLLYLLHPFGFYVDSVIQMFVVVIVFGSGTDYCLFVISRYKEEAATAGPLSGAMRRALRATAAAIAASALTTMAGLSLMALAIFRAFEKAGPSIAVALAVGCVASLTLAPALYLLVGQLIFWPRRRPAPERASDGSGGHGEPSATPAASHADRLWDRIAAFVVRRPLLLALVGVLALAPVSVYSIFPTPNHNIFDELSPNWSSVRGFRLIEGGFPAGAMGPGTLLIEADRPLDAGAGWQFLDSVAARVRALPHVAEVLTPSRPLGSTGPTFPSLDDVPSDADRQRIERHYFSADFKAARLDILLDQGPYSDDSIAEAMAIERVAGEAVAGAPFKASTLLAGPSSTIADIKRVASRDFGVVAGSVFVAIYIILLVVLRRPALGLFLVFGTGLSFMAALGLADLLFIHGLGQPGLDWKVKFFLLVILVAVGVDYNIYLATRIRQEMKRHDDPATAHRVALARTGGIISACGVIVAGTFASMAAGSLALMIQLGFALAVGILIDTFLVRPLLVPAVSLLLTRRRAHRKAATGRLDPVPSSSSSES